MGRQITQRKHPVLRVLIAHNRYQHSGGEDVVAQAERKLLQNSGHEVDLLEVDNAGIVGFAEKIRTAVGTIYSPEAKESLTARISSFHPDVVHVHNFFPLLSPSIYYACCEARVPVVQTLHNYRLICPNAMLLRSGRPCMDCLGRRFAWPGVLHACYRRSYLGTASIVAMTGTHHLLGTWRNRVNVYITLSEFAKGKLAAGGLPRERITVKPNFVPDPGSTGDGRGGFALFAGRLSHEKGVKLLLSAWKKLKAPIPLRIVGDGPLTDEVTKLAKDCGAECLGYLSGDRVRRLMGEAMVLIFPSVWYEGLPMVIVEAFSVGLPVVASGHGSMTSLVEHGRTGLHFQPGSADNLAAKVEWVMAHPSEMERMRRECRAEYLAKYTPECNYQMLMEIYSRVTSGTRQ